MIDYNKFFEKCKELGLYADVTQSEIAGDIFISHHKPGKQHWLISVKNEHVEQWLECFHRCKKL